MMVSANSACSKSTEGEDDINVDAWAEIRDCRRSVTLDFSVYTWEGRKAALKEIQGRIDKVQLVIDEFEKIAQHLRDAHDELKGSE
jgi:hypothetical protein